MRRAWRVRRDESKNRRATIFATLTSPVDVLGMRTVVAAQLIKVNFPTRSLE